MEEDRRNERGQVLVIVALAFVVLLLFAGLAIDGGALHFSRRRMQNAADAAALAGARVLSDAICESEDGSDPADAQVAAAVWDYAERNGVTSQTNLEAHYVRFEASNTVVEFDPPVIVGGGTIPNGASGVIVTTTVTQTTFFMTIVGQDETLASADATAVTGPPLVVGGLRPFGVPREVMGGMNVGDCFTSSFKNCDPSAPLGDPDACYIYDDAGNQIGQHRNWLNLDHVWNEGEAGDGFPRATGGAGTAADLQAWMANGWDGVLYCDCFWSEGCHWGDYIHAKPGTVSSPLNDVPIGVEFVVPVFDVVPHYDEIPEPKADENPQGGDYYYHVVGFGAVEVPTLGDVDQGGGTIRACITEIFWGEGQPSPNSGYNTDVCQAHVMIVTLWE
jgi:Flp pilus assembly protein TadG